MQGSRPPLVSCFFLICPLDSSPPLLVAGSAVTNLTHALEAVPQNVEGPCLAGSTWVPSLDAFCHLPELRSWG